MASLPNRLTRLPRIGDAKIGLIPNDGDHNGWLLCNSTVRMVGKTMYPRLFTALGYTYGGTEAGSTFGLPPLGDKFMLVAGSARSFASTGGSETVTLTAAQMPAHTHTEVQATAVPTPTQLGLLTSVLGIGLQNITKPPTVTTSTGPTGTTGSGAAHDNMPPFMAVNVFIFAGLPATT